MLWFQVEGLRLGAGHAGEILNVSFSSQRCEHCTTLLSEQAMNPPYRETTARSLAKLSIFCVLKRSVACSALTGTLNSVSACETSRTSMSGMNNLRSSLFKNPIGCSQRPSAAGVESSNSRMSIHQPSRLLGLSVFVPTFAFANVPVHGVLSIDSPTPCLYWAKKKRVCRGDPSLQDQMQNPKTKSKALGASFHLNGLSALRPFR